MSILDKLLQKRGIGSYQDLSKEEQKDFENWKQILSKEEMKLEDIKEFCKTQCEVIEGKWRDYNLKNERKSELIAYHTVYKTLLTAIDSPRNAREQLEQYLNQLIN